MHNYLTQSQCGFRRLRSCTDLLIRLESSICKAFASKQHHISVFFDLEKAYDTTWRHGILKELHACNLRGELPLFIKAFLKIRQFQVRVGNVLSDIRMQEEGVPQGSVLSVTLFALAINGITSVIPPDVLSTLFVDDLSLSFSASRMAVAERKLQLCIDSISEWAEVRGFRFSTSKTVVMHFCHVRGAHPDPDLYLYGRRISCVEETRFLGLIFDHKMSWGPHLKDLKARCLKTLDILKALSHTSWGADRKHMLVLYKALVMSKLAYGCEVYSSATDYRLKTLNSIHNVGIRLASGAFKSSPISSLLVDAGEMPLELCRQSLLIQYWYRIQRLPASLTSKEVLRKCCFNYYNEHPKCPKPFNFRVQKLIEEYDLPLNKVQAVKFSSVPPWKLPNIKYCNCIQSCKKDFTDDELRLLFLEHLSEHLNAVFVFTDGSKSSAGVGYAAVFQNFNRSFSLPNYASIFTAELFGILCALKEIVKMKEANFVIFSDSRSVLQVLESFNPLNPLVLDILEWLFLIEQRGQTVSFCWVPAHVGVQGNELADNLAKEASLTKTPQKCSLPFRDYNPVIKSAVENLWQFCWDLESSNKMREITQHIRPWSYYHMPRRRETALCRLRIGHTRLTHGYLMCQDSQPCCSDCVVPLTVRHVVLECPSLNELRTRCFSSCRNMSSDFTLEAILGNNFSESNLFSFLVKANILNKL